MHGFRAEHLVVQSEGFRLYRRGTALGLHAFGRMNDAGSAAWRSAVETEFRRVYPKTFLVDTSELIPDTTMTSRFRVVQFVREHAPHVPQILLGAGGNSHALVVLRAVLRAVGVHHIHLYDDQERFHASIDAIFRGEPPLPV